MPCSWQRLRQIEPQHVWFRHREWGVGGQISYLWRGGDALLEGDVGPTYYIPSEFLVVGIQPSVLMSTGRESDVRYGFGLRIPFNVYIEQTGLVLSPLLGYLDDQLYVHFKAAVGYRFHPNVGAFLGYEYRRSVPNDTLTLTKDPLQGVSLYLRLNQN